MFLSQFKIFKYDLGSKFTYWIITNKTLPKQIYDADKVYENKKALPGQIKKAVLVCEGMPPKVKCKWQFEVKE